MMTYYFYCPKCGHADEIKELPKGVRVNPRGGWGTPLYHFKCPNCGNLDAGFMPEKTGTMDEKVYYRSVIGLYQNLRGV